MTSPATDAVLDELADHLGPLASLDHPLGEWTTYRVGGTAAIFVEVASESDLDALLTSLAALPKLPPFLVLGKGSNLLVADAGFRGLAVKLAGTFQEIDLGDRPTVHAGGATALPVLARQCVEAGLAGFEWAVGVPGSLGGAVAMNAGGHGADLASVLVDVELVDLASAARRSVPASELSLAYRSSAIGASDLVLSGAIALGEGDKEASRALLSEIVQWRRLHQPGGSNAGSIFTNPPGDSAGRIVEAAGLKGFRHGSAHVSEKHANFIQADSDGRADDVRALIEEVRAIVERRVGISLESEVRFVGFSSLKNGEDAETS